MINELHVRNFQSLRKVDLELGRFTVIVGPSSSGKSALIRACRALASNVRGSGVITRGQKHMAVTAHTDAFVVTLGREDRSGYYQLSGTDGSGQAFTKLAGEVPAAITEALRIEPVTDSGSVNFAGQFDKPYLLDESGATIARVLGELTNVNQIFEAVRAANRIRANAASTLKTRRSDLTQIGTRLAAFQGLSDRIKALNEAEQLDAGRRLLEAKISRLDIDIRKVRIAQRAAEASTLPDVPSVYPLTAAFIRYSGLRTVLQNIAVAQKRLDQTSNAVTELTKVAEQHEQQLHDLLDAAGVCPTCGQEIHS